MTSGPAVQGLTPSLRKMLVPLALAQFICSFAGSNMNVMINDISHDLGTTVQGVQVCITLFLLVMAALMIPCGKLTDKVGRKRCFTLGLAVYGVGAVLSAAAPGLGVLILGNSIFEGVGTALLIPPVYILTTMLFTDMKSRAWAFGLISGMGGIGAATGPLIGGLITTAIRLPEPSFWPGSSPGSAAVSGPVKRHCSPPTCSATAHRTWPWSPRMSSGCCSWAHPSWCPPTCRSCGITTPSRPG